jgi:DNA-binding CsgD family transcriptional regulator
LSGGDATQAIAQDLGVGLPTIRTHIRRLLEKTYSRRLIDLLRLVGD